MEASALQAESHEAVAQKFLQESKKKSEKRKEYLEYLMWFLFIGALVSSVVAGHQTVSQSLVLGITVGFLEVFWIAGVILMGIGFGLSLRSSGKMVFSIPALWDKVHEIKPNFIVWFGHWTNFSAATLQGAVMIGAGLFGPTYMRGLLVSGLIDLFLTFTRCIPMTIWMRRASIADRMYITTASEEDIPYYLAAQRLSWGTDMAAPEEVIASRVKVYREGILVARKQDGSPVGFVTTILIKGYDFNNPKSWDETTDEGWCRTHRPNGRIMFGVDMSKMPDAPKNDKVYDDLLLACMARMIRDDLEIACLGGRLPGYSMYADQMTAEEYLFKMDDFGRPLDPQVRMYLSVPGVKALCAIPNYFPDPLSLNNGVLLRWDNPFCSRTNRRWWRLITSNQTTRNILAWMVPRAAAAEMAINDWRKKLRKKRIELRKKRNARRNRRSPH
jgi:hypothetical protein